MIRLVRTKEGKVEIDIKGKREGRGAYLCRDRECWIKALKSQQLEHALKAKVNKNDLEQLGEEAEKLLKESAGA